MKSVSKRVAVMTITALLLFQLGYSIPLPQNDIDGFYGGEGGGGGGNRNTVEFNTVMGHFKDFFMYLPVVMTTLKETMTGFPKFAEGIRVLTSKSGRIEDDCKCKDNNSNEIDNNSRFG